MSEENQENPEVTTPKPKKKWGTRLLKFSLLSLRYFLGISFVLLLVLTILVQFSFFQTFLAKQGLAYLTKKTDFRIEIDNLYFNFSAFSSKY